MKNLWPFLLFVSIFSLITWKVNTYNPPEIRIQQRGSKANTYGVELNRGVGDVEEFVKMPEMEYLELVLKDSTISIVGDTTKKHVHYQINRLLCEHDHVLLYVDTSTTMHSIIEINQRYSYFESTCLYYLFRGRVGQLKCVTEWINSFAMKHGCMYDRNNKSTYKRMISDF